MKVERPKGDEKRIGQRDLGASHIFRSGIPVIIMAIVIETLLYLRTALCDAETSLDYLEVLGLDPVAHTSVALDMKDFEDVDFPPPPLNEIKTKIPGVGAASIRGIADSAELAKLGHSQNGSEILNPPHHGLATCVALAEGSQPFLESGGFASLLVGVAQFLQLGGRLVVG